MQHAGLNSEAIQVACTMGPQCATTARMGGEKTSQWTVCLDKHIQATDATNCIMTLGWKMKVAQYHYNEDSCLQRLSPLVRKYKRREWLVEASQTRASLLCIALETSDFCP